MSRRRQILLDCALLFLGVALLVRPYFLRKYTDQWGSIESTFISDARYLVAHWPHPQWQPLWYGGTRFDYIYPPALRYGTAILSKITGWWPVKAYHFYTITLYCLGVVGVYLLMRAAGRRRGFAILAGAAYALMSPCFLFLKELRMDSGHLTPLRLGVLLRYGEGPHTCALALIPFALAFSWLGFERRRWLWIALAAVMCAGVVSTNFYGATALSICYPLLVWSFWLTRRPPQFFRYALAIPLLAYGLTAFWLTPSYLQITRDNLKFLPHPEGNNWSLWLAIVILTTYITVGRKVALGKADRTWAVFVTGLVTFFALDVLGDQYLGFSLVGDPHRLAPEVDLVLILGAALLLEWLWKRPHLVARVSVCLLVLIAAITTKGYVRRAWQIVDITPDYTQRVEYRITDWLWKNMPNARVSSNGTVRFWYDAWHDLTELGGGSDQGMMNPILAYAQWEISNGEDSTQVLRWLQALGVDALYFSGPKSVEPFKDNLRQERFAALPVIYDDGEDNKLYAIPRRYPARARVVDTGRLSSQQQIKYGDLESLRTYVELVEHGPDAAIELHRPKPEAMVLQAHVQPGQSILVQETFDPAWHATVSGRELPIRKDPLGFMVVDPPAGEQTVRFEFTMPLENRVGWGLTILTLLALAGLARRRGV